MILYGDYWQCPVAHALNAAIVEIDVRDFDICWQRVRRDREAVIVRSDFYLAVG